MTAAEQWIVLATFTDSTPVVYGPFPDPDTAERWAVQGIGRLAACDGWTVTLLVAPTRTAVMT